MNSPTQLAQCLISFGSNLGTRESLIAQAARRIDQSPATAGFQTSRLFETPAIGGPGGQEPFLNAVAAFETSASAREILSLLQTVEQELGRQRLKRWDARSIDLDVVLHGELVGGGTGLIVPHPRYTARQFVLQPARDVAAHYRDPRFGWTLGRLAEHLSDGVPSLALIGGDETIRETLCVRLSEEHSIRTFDAPPLAEPMAVVGNAPAQIRDREPVAAEGGDWTSASPKFTIKVDDDTPWVSAFVPSLPELDSDQSRGKNIPRLIARIQQTTPETRWPAPHQMWPSGWGWPEYRLEVDDLNWAVGEIVSALDSMRCPVEPVTEDGSWWH
ncbi:MAG: 2-amino-4-hydroxy-6-hydroxymethyldihydropteridine diphosphokinase [Pirellulales bacterium]|nr:2-amino-4-hydroxy-6-hydroxymethyldihydropteridine diphosphokinase [Pirellulales bacterium]